MLMKKVTISLNICIHKNFNFFNVKGVWRRFSCGCFHHQPHKILHFGSNSLLLQAWRSKIDTCLKDLIILIIFCSIELVVSRDQDKNDSEIETLKVHKNYWTLTLLKWRLKLWDNLKGLASGYMSMVIYVIGQIMFGLVAVLRVPARHCSSSSASHHSPSCLCVSRGQLWWVSGGLYRRRYGLKSRIIQLTYLWMAGSVPGVENQEEDIWYQLRCMWKTGQEFCQNSFYKVLPHSEV